MGPSCGLTKDHCCPGVSGAERKGSRGPGSPHLRSLSTGQTRRATQTHATHTHTHRATQRRTSTQPTQHTCANCHVHRQQPLPTHKLPTPTTQLHAVRTTGTRTSGPPSESAPPAPQRTHGDQEGDTEPRERRAPARDPGAHGTARTHPTPQRALTTHSGRSQHAADRARPPPRRPQPAAGRQGSLRALLLPTARAAARAHLPQFKPPYCLLPPQAFFFF